jgi:hypothetical protein
MANAQFVAPDPCLALDLPDAFAGHAEDPADGVERVGVLPVEPGPPDDDVPIALGEVSEHMPDTRPHLLAQNHCQRVGQGAGPRDQVRQCRVLVDDSVQGGGDAADPPDLLDLYERQPGLMGDVGGREAAALVHQGTFGGRDPSHLLLQVPRQTNRRSLVGDGARDGLTDPPRRVRRQLAGPGGIELANRSHQPDQAVLEQVLGIEPLTCVPLDGLPHQPLVVQDHALERPPTLAVPRQTRDVVRRDVLIDAVHAATQQHRKADFLLAGEQDLADASAATVRLHHGTRGTHRPVQQFTVADSGLAGQFIGLLLRLRGRRSELLSRRDTRVRPVFRPRSRSGRPAQREGPSDREGDAQVPRLRRAQPVQPNHAVEGELSHHALVVRVPGQHPPCLRQPFGLPLRTGTAHGSPPQGMRRRGIAPAPHGRGAVFTGIPVSPSGGSPHLEPDGRQGFPQASPFLAHEAQPLRLAREILWTYQSPTVGRLLQSRDQRRQFSRHHAPPGVRQHFLSTHSAPHLGVRHPYGDGASLRMHR